jgi:hypothetical protein
VDRVELQLKRIVNSTAQYWNGTNWITSPENLLATLSPGRGSSNVSWIKSAGWPTGANLPDTTYYLQSQVVDRAGQATQINTSFIKVTDTSVPTISYTSSATAPAGTTPLNGSTLTSSVFPTITGVAADSPSGVAKVELFIYRPTSTAGVNEFWSGSSWIVPGNGVTAPKLPATLNPAGGGANVTWSVSANLPSGANYGDGTYYLRAWVYDRVNNGAFAFTGFTKIADSTVPTISYTTSATTPAGTTPVSGSTITGGAFPVITGVAADSPTGVKRVELFIYRGTGTSGVFEFWNGTSWIVPGNGVPTPKLPATLNPPAGGANVSWSVSSGLPGGANYADGTYYLRAWAYDRANNGASAFMAYTKRADSIAPTISYTTSATTPAGTTPDSGSTMTGSAFPVISGVAADSPSGVAKVELFIYRGTGTAGVNEFWSGSSWIVPGNGVPAPKLPAVLNPAGGGASVSWSVSANLPGGSFYRDGIYYLRAWAYDRANNGASVLTSFRKSTVAGVADAQSTVTLSTAEASVSSQSLRLTFTGALNQAAAQNVAHYTLSVNGQPVAAQSAVYEASTFTVTLLLPEGSLPLGSRVTASWRVRDASGAPVNGQTTLQAE